MLQLIDRPVVGQGEHRSGWQYCLQSLQPILSPTGISLEDFCERTFLYNHYKDQWTTYRCPWVGMAHHPPDGPDWYYEAIWTLPMHRLWTLPNWRESVQQLKLLVVFSPSQADWFRNYTDVPIAVVRHPTGLPIKTWSPEEFLAAKEKQLVQVGWFLRDTSAIYRTDVPANWQRCHLWQGTHWEGQAFEVCCDRSGVTESARRRVQRLQRFPDVQYDLLLSRCVVFLHTFAAAANNAVVECIIRNTPICLNRCAAAEYYLGEAYPLFYEDIREVHSLLTVDTIVETYEYLQRMDKWWIHGDMFCETLRSACERHVLTPGQ